jgi:hypothetical protein
VVFAFTLGHDGASSLPIVSPFSVPALPVVAPARRLLAAGDAAGAAALLEPATAGPLAGDSSAWLALGEARSRQGRDVDALVAFDRALTLGGAADPAVRDFVEDAVRTKPALALQALELLPRLGPAGAKLLVEQASRAKAAPVRARARDLAAAAHLEGVDWLASFTLDLEKGATCKDRREAVAKLRALRDKRAIPALRRAHGRHGGFIGLESVNACLDRDAAEAIDFLSALP